MSPKSKKGSALWYSCEKCEAVLAQKDITVHEENCPPCAKDWSHNYIRHGVLYSNVEVYKSQEPPKNISTRELNDMVFVAPSAMQLCKIAIGDPVVLNVGENTSVKIAWPTSEKSLTSVCLTRQAIDLNKLEGRVKIAKLTSDVGLATTISIEYVGKQKLPEVTTEWDILIKNYHERKIFTVGNRICVPYYGKKLIYKILDINSEKLTADNRVTEPVPRKLEEHFDDLNLSESISDKVIFYKALYSTKWTTVNSKVEEKDPETSRFVKSSDIAGYDDLIAEVKHVTDVALGKYTMMKGFDVTRGIILYGTLGVGKSLIAKAVMAESGAHILIVNNSEIYSKYVGETEVKLREIFAEARRNAPSIIFIDDIDNMCGKKNKSSSDQEKRVLSTLLALFDELQSSNANILVMATSSQPHALDPALRRHGRIDKEFEVAVPTQRMRKEILLKLLSKIPNDLSDSNIGEISFVTHGFVAADLFSLCSRATMHAMKHWRTSETYSNEKDVQMNLIMENFNYALTMVSPSAMKEVLVEVPNVKWSDIGGQKDLKLKLQQAVEWPLMHPEAFVRLGITPPRGVLMFGPPGCSKTMIAKALATESQLNFLNIKGPELFSKWVGESERAVREVFRKARQVAPSIIFIDEIDAIGGERASGSSTGSNVQERVLAQLLTELDGVTELGNVTLVAATNRPDRIDKALLRPGRLDRIVYVPLPDSETRQEIFDIKLRKMPVSTDVDINDLVYLTEGYSGAEVQAICHEAAMKALEENLNATVITKEHFKAALSMVTPRTPASLIKLYEDYLIKN
ncbi:ATPase family protein 2 homolog [Diprion similis]|uniref:ATPase family protein 2 homolog n=1 Tax=Diprion similis TaxID=362088 RepID=UPI001EF89289|nr:ATPase family protein 2 homolog [Diprion similis]